MKILDFVLQIKNQIFNKKNFVFSWFSKWTQNKKKWTQLRSSVEYFPFASTFWENQNYLGLLFSKKWTWLRKNQFLALIYLIWKSHILVAIVSTFPIKVDPKNLTWQQKHVAKDNKGQQAKKCHQKRTHWFKEAKLANNIFFTYTMNTSNI